MKNTKKLLAIFLALCLPSIGFSIANPNSQSLNVKATSSRIVLEGSFDDNTWFNTAYGTYNDSSASKNHNFYKNDDGTLSMNLSDAGSTFSIHYGVTSNDGINALVIELDFDDSLFELAGSTAKDSIHVSSKYGIGSNYEVTGSEDSDYSGAVTIEIDWDDNTDFTTNETDGYLFTVDYKLKSGVEYSSFDNAFGFTADSYCSYISSDDPITQTTDDIDLEDDVDSTDFGCNYAHIRTPGYLKTDNDGSNPIYSATAVDVSSIPYIHYYNEADLDDGKDDIDVTSDSDFDSTLVVTKYYSVDSSSNKTELSTGVYPIDAGNYAVAAYIGQSKYIMETASTDLFFSIDPYELSLTASVSEESKTYNGSAQTWDSSLFSINSTDGRTDAMKARDTSMSYTPYSIDSVTNNTYTDAGTYTANVNVTLHPNYTLSSTALEVTVKITQAQANALTSTDVSDIFPDYLPNSLDATVLGKRYNGTNLSYSATATYGTVLAIYSTDNENWYDVTSSTDLKDASVYYLKFYVIGNDSYVSVYYDDDNGKVSSSCPVYQVEIYPLTLAPAQITYPDGGTKANLSAVDSDGNVRIYKPSTTYYDVDTEDIISIDDLSTVDSTLWGSFDENPTVTFTTNSDTSIATASNVSYATATSEGSQTITALVSGNDNYASSTADTETTFEIIYAEGTHTLSTDTWIDADNTAFAAYYAFKDAKLLVLDPNDSSVSSYLPEGYDFVKFQYGDKLFIDSFTNGSNDSITADKSYTFTAIWSIHSYTITWSNLDGNAIDNNSNKSFTESYEYKTSVSYKGLNPTKNEDADYSYTFKEWGYDVTSNSYTALDTSTFEVTKDITFFAYYTSTADKLGLILIVYDETGAVVDTKSYIKESNTNDNRVKVGNDILTKISDFDDYCWFAIDGWYSTIDSDHKVFSDKENFMPTVSNPTPESVVTLYGYYKFNIGTGDVTGDGKVLAGTDIVTNRQMIVGGYNITEVDEGDEWETETTITTEVLKTHYVLDQTTNAYPVRYFLHKVSDSNKDGTFDVRDVTTARMAVVGGYGYGIVSNRNVTGQEILLGKVNVTAAIDKVTYYSPTSIDGNGLVTNDTNIAGATSTYNNGVITSDNNNTSNLTITGTNFAPGEKATISLKVKNETDFDSKYFVDINLVPYGQTFGAFYTKLNIKNDSSGTKDSLSSILSYSSDWYDIEHGQKLDNIVLEVEIPSELAYLQSPASFDIYIDIYTENDVSDPDSISMFYMNSPLCKANDILSASNQVNDYPQAALDEAEEQAEDFSAYVNEFCVLLWNRNTDRFVFADRSRLTSQNSSVNYYLFAKTEDDISSTCSNYLLDDFASDRTLDISTGLDVGNNRIDVINYTNNDSVQEVVIRTVEDGTTTIYVNGLVTNESSDTVIIYNGAVHNEKGGQHSTHLHGNITYIDLENGNVVFESDCVVEKMGLVATKVVDTKVVFDDITITVCDGANVKPLQNMDKIDIVRSSFDIGSGTLVCKVQQASGAGLVDENKTTNVWFFQDGVQAQVKLSSSDNASDASNGTSLSEVVESSFASILATKISNAYANDGYTVIDVSKTSKEIADFYEDALDVASFNFVEETSVLSDGNQFTYSTNKDEVTWAVSDETILSISGSVVTALKPGMAYLRATYKGRTIECEVNVKYYTSGLGTKDNPFIISNAKQFAHISDDCNYDEDTDSYLVTSYNYYKIADGVTEIELGDISVTLYGSFDGNHVTFTNVKNGVFQTIIGEGTCTTSTGSSTIKDFNVILNNSKHGVVYWNTAQYLSLEGLAVHGTVEGSYNVSSFIDYCGCSNSSEHHILIKNCLSDADVIITSSGAGGFVGHPYSNASSTFTVVNSTYEGDLYSSSGKENCKLFAGGWLNGTLTIDGTLANSNGQYDQEKSHGIIVEAGVNPDKYETFTVSKVTGFDHAKAILSIGPNGNGTTHVGGNYAKEYIIETDSLVLDDNSITTSDIKYFNITSNGHLTTETGLTTDGHTYNVIDEKYNNEVSTASVRIIQYDSNNVILKITSWDICPTPDTSVAKIGEVGYSTLASAFENAVADDVIVLYNDVSLTNSIIVDKNVTLDLCGYNVTVDSTWNAVSPTKQGLFYVKSNATFTVNDSFGNGSIDSSDNASVYGAIVLTINGQNDTSKLAKLVVNGGNIIGNYYGIVTNGSRCNTEITINGGLITAADEEDGTSIYHPSTGKLTINGGTLKGSDGLAVKGGTPVTINGGTFIATMDRVDPTAAQVNGCNSVGSALYIEGNYANDAQVIVNAGTFEVADPTAPAVRVLFSDNPASNLIIFGGTFDNDPSAYVASLVEVKTDTPNEGLFTVVKLLDGAGTSTDPYLIKTKDDLVLFQSLVNGGNSFSGKNIKLVSNIDLTGVTWTPIGTSSNPFSGNFDGNNKTISNLTVSVETCSGLFGYTKGNVNTDYSTLSDVWDATNNIVITTNIQENNYSCVIKNLTISNASVTATKKFAGGLTGRAIDTYISDITLNNVDVSSTTEKYAGTLAGDIGGTCINNVINDNSSSVICASGHSAGGIVGSANNYGTNNNVAILNCTNYASVITNGNGSGNTSGIIGYAQNASLKALIVDNCTNYGSITGCSEHISGVVGTTCDGNQDSIVSNCNNYGTITGNAGTKKISGVVGFTGNDIYNCSNFGTITGTASISAAGVLSSGDGATLINCYNFVSLDNVTCNVKNSVSSSSSNGTCISGTFNDVAALLDAIQGINGKVVLLNCTVSDTSGTLVLPSSINTLVSDAQYFEGLDISNCTSDYITISINNFDYTLYGDASTKTLGLDGNNNKTTFASNCKLNWLRNYGNNGTYVKETGCIINTIHGASEEK